MWAYNITAEVLFLSTTRCTNLHCNVASGAVVVHEDAQHVRDELRQVELELPSQCHHDLLNQEDDGVLHGVVWCPVLLQVTGTIYRH